MSYHTAAPVYFDEYNTCYLNRSIEALVAQGLSPLFHRLSSVDWSQHGGDSYFKDALATVRALSSFFKTLKQEDLPKVLQSMGFPHDRIGDVVDLDMKLFGRLEHVAVGKPKLMKLFSHNFHSIEVLESDHAGLSGHLAHDYVIHTHINLTRPPGNPTATIALKQALRDRRFATWSRHLSFTTGGLEFDFPLNVDVRPFTHPKATTALNRSTVYRIHTMVVHTNNLGSRHFFSLVYVGDGRFQRRDKGQVIEVSMRDAMQLLHSSSTGVAGIPRGCEVKRVMVKYERINDESDAAMDGRDAALTRAFLRTAAARTRANEVTAPGTGDRVVQTCNKPSQSNNRLKA